LGDLLKDYLELKGKFDVTLCTDGDEAISQFKKNNYDLCIFDVMMPKKDGFTVGREIRKQTILFLLSLPQQRDDGR
jgi:DNA-binding response OmpR family regulator